MRTFRNIAEMERFYYGDVSLLDIQEIKKAKDAMLSGETGYWNKIYGLKAWAYSNYEKNALAAIPKEPWNRSSWRAETASGVTFPSGGLAEGSASDFTDIADTTHVTLALITGNPKLIDHGFGFSWQGLMVQDDDTPNLEYYREQKSLAHARAISAYLIQDADTPASNGFESCDRVASTKAEASHFSAATDGDIYGLDRDAATTYNANVSSTGTAAADLRDLTISLIDTVWSDTTKSGGQPDFILTGYNTIKVWSALLEAERRYDVLGKATFVPRYGEAAGVTPGVETGFSVATYFGVPIIPCQDYDSSIATVRTDEIAPIFFGDSRFLRLGVKLPTQYLETRWPEDAVLVNEHGMEGHYVTVGELRAYRFNTHGKLRDIK